MSQHKTESVTAADLNYRDTVIVTIGGHPVAHRIDTILPYKFAERVVAYELHVTAADGTRYRMQLNPEDQVNRLVEG
jgi:hypothetical protein